MRSAFMANIVMCLCSISSEFQTVSSTCQSLLLNCLLLFYEPFWWWQIFICYFFHFGGNLKNDFGKSGFIRLIATFVKRRSLTNEPNHNFWVFLAELGDVFPLVEKTWKVGVSRLISYTELYLLWLMDRSKVLDFRSKS